MITIEGRRWLDELWKRAAGRPVVDEHATLDELKRTEWSVPFELMMRNRMIVGSLRYGRLGKPDKPAYDRVGEAIRRLRLYEQTGNDELLVDAANICMVEFLEGKHPKKHFVSVDDGQHAEVK